MLITRVLSASLAVPAFAFLIEAKSPGALIGATFILALLTALRSGAAMVALPELLPSSVRSTGISIAWAVGVAIFGGSAQCIVTWMIGVTGNPAMPVWWVTITSVMAAVGIVALPQGRDHTLQA